MTSGETINVLMMPATAAQADAMVPLMAPGDLARLGSLDIRALLESSPLSWCSTHIGKPMCIGGVTANGVAWMMSTPELHRQKRFFLRQTKTVMTALETHYDRVVTVVERCYPMSHRWLVWAGFESEPMDRHILLHGRDAHVRVFWKGQK